MRVVVDGHHDTLDVGVVNVTGLEVGLLILQNKARQEHKVGGAPILGERWARCFQVKCWLSLWILNGDRPITKQRPCGGALTCCGWCAAEHKGYVVCRLRTATVYNTPPHTEFRSPAKQSTVPAHYMWHVRGICTQDMACRQHVLWIGGDKMGMRSTYPECDLNGSAQVPSTQCQYCAWELQGLSQRAGSPELDG